MLCALAAATLALDRDPYLADPRAMVLPLPDHWPIELVVACVVGLGLVLVTIPNRPGFRAGPIGAIALASLSGFLLLLATPFVRPGVHFTCVTLNLALLVSLALYLLRSRASADEAGGTWLENGVTMAMSLGLTFLVGEGVASLRSASHAVGYTLASRAWFSRYWSLTNSAGYRDSEWPGGAAKRIDVIGDSFVAGLGIANVDDRMSNLLDRRLRPEFRVRNLGWNGADTRDELKRLRSLPTPPDLLILSYYANDIQEACGDAGHRLPGFTPYANVPWALRALLRRSYLLDALYWRFPQSDLVGYEGSLESCYQDPKALELHRRDLEAIVIYCRERRLPLLVVAFPHLVRAEPTRKLIEPVIEFFGAQGVLVVDVFPLLERLPVRDRIVNSNDAHPSVLLNRLVADAVLSALDANGLLREVPSR